jgi:hypothetical protein
MQTSAFWDDLVMLRFSATGQDFSSIQKTIRLSIRYIISSKWAGWSKSAFAVYYPGYAESTFFALLVIIKIKYKF